MVLYLLLKEFFLFFHFGYWKYIKAQYRVLVNHNVFNFSHHFKLVEFELYYKV